MPVGIELVAAARAGNVAPVTEANALRAALGLFAGIASGIAAAKAREAAVQEWLRRWAEYFPTDVPPFPDTGSPAGPDAAPVQMLPMWTADP